MFIFVYSLFHSFCTQNKPNVGWWWVTNDAVTRREPIPSAKFDSRSILPQKPAVQIQYTAACVGSSFLMTSEYLSPRFCKCDFLRCRGGAVDALNLAQLMPVTI